MKIHYKDGAEFFLAICRAQTSKQMQKVIDSCEDIDVRDKYDMTALMHAVYSANKKVAELLIKNGADPEAKNTDDESVLVLAPQGEIKAMILRAIVTKYWQEKRLARINKSHGLSK